MILLDTFLECWPADEAPIGELPACEPVSLARFAVLKEIAADIVDSTPHTIESMVVRELLRLIVEGGPLPAERYRACRDCEDGKHCYACENSGFVYVRPAPAMTR